MGIHIIAATFWEVKDFIHALKMKKTGQTAYRSVYEGQPLALHISGIGQENARRTLEKIFTTEPSPLWIISTGFACSLKPEIEAGDLVLDNEKSDPKISSMIAGIAGAAGLKVFQGKFHTHDKPLMTGEEKNKISGQSGAIAVEMESQALYRLCKKKGVPFCSFRSVSDTLHQNLPHAVLFLNSRGGIGPKFWGQFFFRPSDWPGFFQLFFSSRKAGKSLSKILQEFFKGGPAC